MCLNAKEDKCKMINKKKMGSTLRGILTEAKFEKRLVCGLLPAIAHLEKSPDDVVFCILPESRPGDAATHIHAVLLQAFCYENYIPVIKVDSSKKLGTICEASAKVPKGCNCAIVIRDTKIQSEISQNRTPSLSKTEQIIADFYESTSRIFPTPIIDLPI